MQTTHSKKLYTHTHTHYDIVYISKPPTKTTLNIIYKNIRIIITINIVLVNQIKIALSTVVGHIWLELKMR